MVRRKLDSNVYIIGSSEQHYQRNVAESVTSSDLIAGAASAAVKNAGIDWNKVDGLGISSFTLGPDHAIDFAWKAGMQKLNWLMQDTNGGASGINLLIHAIDAIKSGQASNILLVSGDRMNKSDFAKLVDSYNLATSEHISPLPMQGPNALFAMLTKRQMDKYGLTKEDYGRLVINQRSWAEKNERAIYREPLTMSKYLSAPLICDPLVLFDCVPPVSGANAIVVSASDHTQHGKAVLIKAAEASFNFDNQEGDGLQTGLVDIAPRAWSKSGLEPKSIDLVSVYDDYPAMIIAQLVDAGLINEDRISEEIEARIFSKKLPVNTSGGQLSAGQAGAAAGMHCLVEAHRLLAGVAGVSQVEEAKRAIVTGYGMVLYRYGACANIAILETSNK